RTTMERPFERDDHVALGEARGCLHGALGHLGPGVAEEHACIFGGHPLNDRLRELLLRLGPKGAGRRNEPLHLRFDRGVPARVAVTEGQTTDSIDCVQVDAPLGVAYPEGPTTLRGALLDVAIEGDVPGLVGRPAAIVHGAGDLSKVLPGTQAPGR